MLEQEFKHYLDNQAELAKSHFSRFIIIKGQEILGDYPTEVDAILAGTNDLGLELGTFLVQHCLPGVENYTQFFHSRAMFTS